MHPFVQQVFNFFSKFFAPKVLEIYAPCDGELVPQKDIPDEAFSTEAMGSGIGIKPTGTEFVSPIAGSLVVLFPTKHAYAIQDPTTQITVFIHIGINTVSIPAELKPFTSELKQGDTLTSKQPLCQVDLSVISKEATSIVTPLLVQPEHLGTKKIKLLKTSGTVVKGELLMTVS